MKAVVDQDACIGCGLCPQVAPEIYEMDGDKAKTIVDEVPAEKEQEAQDAAEQCPVDAITVS